jgi:hypothetical protein
VFAQYRGIRFVPKLNSQSQVLRLHQEGALQ